MIGMAHGPWQSEHIMPTQRREFWRNVVVILICMYGMNVNTSHKDFILKLSL